MKKNNYYFENSIEYIFTKMSEEARNRKHILKLQRRDIDEDVGMVSSLMNNSRTKRHPNIITNAKGNKIYKALNYESLDAMLWGKIDWKTLLKKSLFDLAKNPVNINQKENLNNKLIHILKEYVPFSVEVAHAELTNYDINDDILKRAIDWTLDVAHLFDQSDSETYKNIYKIFEKKFKNQFFINNLDIDEAIKNKKGIDKFTNRFPKFMSAFLSNEIQNININDSSSGEHAYSLAKEKYEIENDLLTSYHDKVTEFSDLNFLIQNDDDKRMFKICSFYEDILSDLKKIQDLTYANKKANQ